MAASGDVHIVGLPLRGPRTGEYNFAAAQAAFGLKDHQFRAVGA